MIMADTGAEDGRRLVGANVRRLRTARRLSLDALAVASGVGRATLARIEAGHANSTLETLYAIADSLDVSLGALVTEGAASLTHVMRAGEAVRITGAVDAELIDRLYGFGYAEMLSVRFLKGRRRRAKPHPAGVVEHLLVTAGRIEAGPIGESTELDTGDYLRFPGDVEHVYAALDGEAVAVIVMAYREANAGGALDRAGR
jgi:transcriptional regulator with XRE-family HTH domain